MIIEKKKIRDSWKKFSHLIMVGELSLNTKSKRVLQYQAVL